MGNKLKFTSWKIIEIEKREKRVQQISWIRYTIPLDTHTMEQVWGGGQEVVAFNAQLPKQATSWQLMAAPETAAESL